MTFTAKAVAAATIVAVSVVTLNVDAVAETGRASWYALTSRTASGEVCDPNAMTAAHRSLPFGSKVKVEDLTTGKSIVVRINDRGPFIAGRVIDLTKAAAARLGMLKRGVAKVRITVLSRG